jgi:hypothetical protein
VPEGVVIGLLKCEETSELRVPFVTIMTNDWINASQTKEFVENLCLRGQFKADYSKLIKIDESNDLNVKKAIVNQKDSGRTAQQTSTFFIPFNRPINCRAETAKIFN